MGAFVAKHFTTAYKKVGTFTLIGRPNTPIGVRKVGGNVAAYFRTPDLRVLGAVGGPVPPEAFLKEAERAVALAEATRDGLSEDAGALALSSLRGPSSRGGGSGGRRRAGPDVRDILAAQPLAPLDRIYRLVFENALAEEISDAPVSVETRLFRAQWNGENPNDRGE